MLTPYLVYSSIPRSHPIEECKRWSKKTTIGEISGTGPGENYRFHGVQLLAPASRLQREDIRQLPVAGGLRGILPGRRGLLPYTCALRLWSGPTRLELEVPPSEGQPVHS
ncbi:hypothetical protein B0H11DRAFT_2189711 [Mycena galericulata]|nr:hypothetical protein B0H11DRAFT_2189711 [Mycena galericulata]